MPENTWIFSFQQQSTMCRSNSELPMSRVGTTRMEGTVELEGRIFFSDKD